MATTEPPKQLLKDIDQIMAFMLAGNAYVTLKSKSAEAGKGLQYGFRIHRYEYKGTPYFGVAQVTCGMKRSFGNLNPRRGYEFSMRRRNAELNEYEQPVRAFRWVWDRLRAGQVPTDVEIWHEGRCGHCARVLTDPESIARGLGPICAEKLQQQAGEGPAHMKTQQGTCSRKGCHRPIMWMWRPGRATLVLDLDPTHLAPGDGPIAGFDLMGNLVRGYKSSPHDPDAVLVHLEHGHTCLNPPRRR